MNGKDATDRLLLIARDRLRNRPGAFNQFQFTLERTAQGMALIAGAQAMPYAYEMGEEMGNPKAAELIREHLTKIVDFWAKSQPLPPAVDALPGAAPLPITDAREAAPAPVVQAGDGPAKPRSNKSEKTQIFEAKVLELLERFWNDRTPGTEPTKGDLCKQVFNEILRTNVRGNRKTTSGMVTDAAKKWRVPLVLPGFVAESKFNAKRHPFKGDK